MVSGLKVAFMWRAAEAVPAKPKPEKPKQLPAAETLSGVFAALWSMESGNKELRAGIQKMVSALDAATKGSIPAEVKGLMNTVEGIARRVPDTDDPLWVILRGLYDSSLPDKAWGYVDPKVADRIIMNGKGLRRIIDGYGGDVSRQATQAAAVIAQTFDSISRRLGETPADQSIDFEKPEEQKEPTTLQRKKVSEVWDRYGTLEDLAKVKFRGSLSRHTVKGVRPTLKLEMFSPEAVWGTKDTLLGAFQKIDPLWWDEVAESLYGLMGKLIRKAPVAPLKK